MVKAQRIQEKVKGVGFEWDNVDQVYAKVQEELKELDDEVKSGDQEKKEKEFGDVLFALINYGRWIGVNPENALAKTNIKFQNRFQWMEEKIKEDNEEISELGLEKLDEYWDKSKKVYE